MVSIANKAKHDIRFKGKPKDERTRIWTILVYEDSAPADWREILRSLHIPVYISPYHDRDIRANGESKKPHWHVVLVFKGKKSIAQIQAISDMISGTKVIWEECAVGDLDGMVRYLIHFDDADKAQYDINGIETMGGADVLAHFATANDVDEIVGEMMDWCVDHTCYSFFRLSNYARHNRPDWFRTITTSRTVFLTNWLKSMQWDLRMEQQGIDATRYAANDYPDQDDAEPEPDECGNEIAEDEDCEQGKAIFDDEPDSVVMDPDSVVMDPDNTTPITTHHHGNFCVNCGGLNVVKDGKTAGGTQRYKCKDCGARYVG